MFNKRKRQFVNLSVEGAILARLMWHGLMFMVTAVGFLYFVELVIGDPRDAAKNLVSRYGPIVPAMLALAPIFLRHLSNRFASPMVRLHQAIHDFAEGREVAPMQIEDDEFWQEFATDFNKIVQRVQTAENEFNDDDIRQPVAAISEIGVS